MQTGERKRSDWGLDSSLSPQSAPAVYQRVCLIGEGYCHTEKGSEQDCQFYVSDFHFCVLFGLR
eukprot:c18929_g1_i1 orf=1111-1302(+)